MLITILNIYKLIKIYSWVILKEQAHMNIGTFGAVSITVRLLLVRGILNAHTGTFADKAKNDRQIG